MWLCMQCGDCMLRWSALNALYCCAVSGHLSENVLEAAAVGVAALHAAALALAHRASAPLRSAAAAAAAAVAVMVVLGASLV